ncbi:MAG: hypothetical protein CMJ81_07735 [Planctomycetaceae bacterium]|nr:hypothetical protein [Planctomycetaceae bacterium]MBP61052.1 hypothetical protein [Planctomycetaceae bacterium]
MVVTENGKTYTGVLRRGSSNGLGTLQGDSYRPAIAKSDIEDLFPSSVSTMPQDLSDNLTLQEMVDLSKFLDDLPTSSVSTEHGSGNGKLR